MTRPPPAPPARRLVESYDPAFRASMTIAATAADDPVAIAAAADALPEEGAMLLDLLLLVSVPGETVPDRLRSQVERAGGSLWRAALVLPRATQYSGADVHPLHYAGSCRLNPALRDRRPRGFTVDAPDAKPTFPPSDARWDAVVVAALLESTPGQLTMDGVLRKDVERRLFASLGPDQDRWSLALQVARLSGLVRASEGRLRGTPEAHPRPLGEPASLFSEPVEVAAAALWQRLMSDRWLDVPGVLDRLRVRARACLYSPQPGAPFDDASWETHERALLLRVLDVLHRAGFVDATRVGEDIHAVRLAAPRPVFSTGFLLTPDNDILVHTGELSSPDYGRLARMAPYVDGARMHRHRLTRDGVTTDLAHGNTDTLDFLVKHSRTGLPPSVADNVREWQRSATRIMVLTGIDVVEDADGKLRISTGEVEGRVIDYGTPPRARFLYRHGRITVPTGWDALTVRSTVSRIARAAGFDGEDHVFIPEARTHTDAEGLLRRLREHYGGELPGEIEVLVLAGADLDPVRSEPAHVVHLPAEAAAALRRDWIAGPLLRRAITLEECVVSDEDLPKLIARVRELGLRWET